MKKYIPFLLFLLCITGFSQSDDEFKTIFGGKDRGGYGSFSVGYTRIDTSDAIIFSARGGVILGHTLAMGIGGSGFASEYQDDLRLGYKASLSGGYGGVFLELILVAKSPVHLSIPILAGLGGVSYTTWVNEGTDYDRVNIIEDVSSFLILEPGVELEVNLNRYFRVAAYFNYRYTSNLDLTSSQFVDTRESLVRPDALQGYSAGIIFKFGKF